MIKYSPRYSKLTWRHWQLTTVLLFNHYATEVCLNACIFLLSKIWTHNLTTHTHTHTVLRPLLVPLMSASAFLQIRQDSQSVSNLQQPPSLHVCYYPQSWFSFYVLDPGLHMVMSFVASGLIPCNIKMKSKITWVKSIQTAWPTSLSSVTNVNIWPVCQVCSVPVQNCP